MRNLALASALFGLVLAACSGSSDEPAAGTGGTAGAGGTAGTGGSGGSPCQAPSFSSDCAQVGNFQCGFSSSCAAGKLTASWHHHYFCDGQEQIANYSCTSLCPAECGPEYQGWPQNGALFVQEACSGAAGAGGEPSDGGSCVEEHGACASASECCPLWEGTAGASGGQQTGTGCDADKNTCERCSNTGEICGPYHRCCPGKTCGVGDSCVEG
jgi:hypothetical protein